MSRYFDIFTSDSINHRLNESSTRRPKSRLRRRLNEALWYVDWIDIDGERCQDKIRANSAEEAEEKFMEIDPDYVQEVVYVGPWEDRANSHINY